MSASRPSSALKDRRPSTSMGFASGSRPTSASRENALSSSAAEPTLRPPLALLNPSHLRPMSALTSASLSSRPASSMSRSSFSGSRLVALNSNVEGPGSFQGAKRRPATSNGLARPSTAIGSRSAACATPLQRWAVDQGAFGSDSDSPGAISEGESTLGGGAAGDSSFMVAEEINMEPDLSPRTTIALERRLWKVRHSLNSMPAPEHVMSRLFGNDEQWRYAQQHPKDTPANAPLAQQSQDFGNFSKIELDPACAARADLSGISMQQLSSLKLMFERACHRNRGSMDSAISGTVSSTMSLTLDEFCAFLLDATGSAHAASSLLFRRADYDSKNAVTWDDVLPHILKKHATQQANERDIPYSINMLRADPDISHQKLREITLTQDQVACMIVCPLQRVLCTLGMVSRVVMFWPLPTLKHPSSLQSSALHIKFAHELVQGIALGAASKASGAVDLEGDDDAAQGSFVTCRSMCYVSSREGDAWLVMGHEGIIHLLNVKKREHRAVLITAPEIASLVCTSGAFDDSDPSQILCVGCESGCILLYDPRTARQDSKPFRRLEMFSHVTHSIKSSSSSSFFITEGEHATTTSSSPLSPGSSGIAWAPGTLKRDVGLAVTHMCRWPNVGVFVALARGSVQVYDQQRWTLQRTLEFHTDTLVGMCIDVLHKVIITASKDRRLLLWDPFIERPISEVHVHSAPYVSMLLLQSQQLLVTVSADKIVDIWHLQTMSRVKRFTDDFRHKGINRLSAAVWDPMNHMIFTAGNAIRRFSVNAVELALRKQKAKTGTVSAVDNASMLELAEGAGLSQPIIAVLFTSTLGQLIVVSNTECRVIEAQSGSTIITFSLKAYGRCSCACLDICGRRLMTGSETGVVCMWEYSLGRLLKIVNRMPPVLQLDKAPAVKERVEISCICCVAEANLTVRPLIIGDWNHNLVMCSDSTSSEAVVEAPPSLLQGHRHDVLCAVSCGNFIVSGDANGLAMVWFILNGHRRHIIQVTKSESRDGLSGTSINCGVWISSARLCYLGTSEGEIVGLNPVLGQIKTRTSLADTPSVSCLAQGTIWSSETGRQFQMVTGTTDGNLFFFSVPVIDQNAVALLNINKTSSHSRLKQSVHSNADALLNSKGSKLQKLGEQYVPILEMHTQVIAHQNSVSAVVIAEISGITVSGSVDGGLRLWSWSGKPLSVIGTSIPWPYWEISNQSNQELICQEIERLEQEREKEAEYERMAILKEIQDAKDNSARLHKQWCVNLAKTSSGAGLLPLSESVDVFRFLGGSSSTFESADATNAEGKPKGGSLLVPSSMSYRPIDSIDHICASLLKQNRQRIEDAVRASEEESRLGRIFIQLETAMTQSEDPRDAEELKILEEKLKLLRFGVDSEECAGIDKGRLSDPPHHSFPEMNIDDLVPPAMGHKSLKGRLELLIELHEVLNKSCFLIYDSFRAYCAISAVDLERFFTLSRTDFARFCKDTRCPRHVLTKTDAIFRTVEPHAEAKYKTKGPNRELVLSEFVELLVRVANVCYPNRTALGKKMALFIDKHLNYALRHRPDKFHSMVAQPEICPQLSVLRRHQATLLQVFKKMCSEQNQKAETDIFGFCALCQRAGLLDHVMTLQRAATMFIYCNYEEESPTSGWQEWDWNLTFGEFNQAVLRIADLKLSNSQEKAVQMRLDLFMKGQPFKDYLATKFAQDPLPPPAGS